MLKQRVITAIVLLAIVLPCIFTPQRWPFTLLATAALSIAAWEWARLLGLRAPAAIATGIVFFAATLGAALAGWHLQRYSANLWLGISVVWLLVAIATLRLGVAGWSQIPWALRFAGGLWILATAWLAVLAAHGLGVNFLLSTLALVWAADIGAYFAGKALGQKLFARKLAPAISPGKSWEGVLGGIVAVLLLAQAWMAADRHGASQWGHSLYSLLAAHSAIALVIGCVVLAAMSVMGDLQESLVKRSAGMKDSSQILPGHGGMLDRIDGLLPAIAAAIALVTWANA